MAEWKPTNRQKAKAIREKRQFWCDRCDAYRVCQLGKCKACGHIENRKKVKDRLDGSGEE
jgi:predicted ATP-dependent serine protease